MKNFWNINNKDILFKIQLSISLIVILFLVITGSTYAYLYAIDYDNNTIGGDMATVNLTLSVNRIFPKSSVENTGVLVPQISTDVNSPLETALKSGCVDGNKNVVCHVYEIVVKNNGGTATLLVDGTALFYGDAELTTSVSNTMPNLRWKIIDSVNVTTPSNSSLGSNIDRIANNSEDNVFVSNVSLATNVERKYYMIVWINETGTNQSIDVGNSFYGEIKFDSSVGDGVTATFTNYTIVS